MNDKLYSLEEIEKTYDRLNCRSQGWTPTFAELKEELTHPKPEFSEGQVVAVKQAHQSRWYPRYYLERIDGEEVRELSLKEVGPICMCR